MALRNAFDPLGTAEHHPAPDDLQNRYFHNPPVQRSKVNFDLDNAGKRYGRIFCDGSCFELQKSIWLFPLAWNKR
jgi:hypothetical protein